MKEIWKIRFEINDYGSTYEAKPIETNSMCWKTEVRKHLRKNAYAMDLSENYTFKILSVHGVGYGSV